MSNACNSLCQVTEKTSSSSLEVFQFKTIFEYDLKGQLIQKTDPTGAITKMTYDPNGNLLIEIDAANQRKVFSYNSVNKVTQVQTADDFISYNYNIKDEVVGICSKQINFCRIKDRL